MKTMYVVDDTWLETHRKQLTDLDTALLALDFERADRLADGLVRALREAKRPCIAMNDPTIEAAMQLARNEDLATARNLAQTHLESKDTSALRDWLRGKAQVLGVGAQVLDDLPPSAALVLLDA